MFLTIKSEIISYISRKNTRTRNLSVLLGKLSISGRGRRREGEEEGRGRREEVWGGRWCGEGGGVEREGVKERLYGCVGYYVCSSL